MAHVEQRAPATRRLDGTLRRAGEPATPVWARGVGHACYGLLSMLEALPATAPLRQRIERLLTRTLKAMIPHQDAASGLWRNVIDEPAARLETSGSTALACVLFTGLHQQWLDAEVFSPVAEKLFSGMWQMHWHGGLGGSCRGTAAAPELSYYLARPQGWAVEPYLAMAIALRQRWLQDREPSTR